MKRFTKFLLVVALFAFSCRSNEIIPPKEIVPILVKIYQVDATVLDQNYRKKFYKKDSIEYYTPIIKSFGFTSAQFDSSLNYYTRKPKVLDEIMDKVIFELSKIQTDLEQEAKNDSIQVIKTRKLWKLNPSYDLSLSSSNNLIVFEIPVVGLGFYDISYNVQMFPDDETEKPQLKVFFWRDDKTESGNVSQYTTKPYEKNGEKTEISVIMELSDSTVTHLKGVILDGSNTDKKYRQHVSVSNIRVIYRPNVYDHLKLRRKEME